VAGAIGRVYRRLHEGEEVGMRNGRRLGLVGAAGLIGLLSVAPPARAVEYRLQVVSIFTEAYASYHNAAELADGASGPGLVRLETSLDRGDVPSGAVLFDRRVQPVRQSLARAYGGARVVPELKPGGEGSVLWDEITWDGKPGERSVWLALPTIRNIQELRSVALKGSGSLRNFQPYGFPRNGTRAAAVALPLNFLWAQEERGSAWDKYISRSLDLRDGIGAVVGVNFNPMFPDQVYLIVSHAQQPTTYKAVLVWRQRKSDREGTGVEAPIMVH
jgi:hypothetical protein